MSPAQPTDCVRRLPTQASVNSGSVPPAANSSVNSRGAAHADEEVAPSAPVVAEPGEEQLAERVRQHAERADRADAHQRLAVTDAAPAQLLRQQRRGDREVRAAVIAGRVAAEQQHHGPYLGRTQRHGRSGTPGRVRWSAVASVLVPTFKRVLAVRRAGPDTSGGGGLNHAVGRTHSVHTARRLGRFLKSAVVAVHHHDRSRDVQRRRSACGRPTGTTTQPARAAAAPRAISNLTMLRMVRSSVSPECKNATGEPALTAPYRGGTVQPPLRLRRALRGVGVSSGSS